MKRSLLILISLAVLTVRLHAQIPDGWTLEKLKKLYGGEVTIDAANSHIKSISFVKRNPESFHGGECFVLVITVLRGPGAPAVKADDPEIKVTDKGDTTIWTDHLTGYSVEDAGPGFMYTARHDGVVRVTAKWVEGKHDSKFVLTDVK
jgi:hypothetical protein